MGELCVGKYSYDDLWYRAEVVGIREGVASEDSTSSDSKPPRLVNLKFIDYGNEEEVPFIPVSASEWIHQSFPSSVSHIFASVSNSLYI